VLSNSEESGHENPSCKPRPSTPSRLGLAWTPKLCNGTTSLALSFPAGSVTGGPVPRPPWSTPLVESECSQSQNIGWWNCWVENKNDDLLNNPWLLQRQVTLLASFPAVAGTQFAYPRRDGQAELTWIGRIGNDAPCQRSAIAKVG